MTVPVDKISRTPHISYISLHGLVHTLNGCNCLILIVITHVSTESTGPTTMTLNNII